jgi:hypothetical protein
MKSASFIVPKRKRSLKIVRDLWLLLNRNYPTRKDDHAMLSVIYGEYDPVGSDPEPEGTYDGPEVENFS